VSSAGHCYYDDEAIKLTGLAQEFAILCDSKCHKICFFGKERGYCRQAGLEKKGSIKI